MVINCFQPILAIGLPCGLYQLMSHTKGTALLFVSKYLFYPSLSSPPTSPPPPSHPPPIDQSLELKSYLKNQQIACKISLKIITYHDIYTVATTGMTVLYHKKAQCIN